jgi:hypothetical protein
VETISWLDLNIDGRPAGPQFSGGCWKDKLAPQHLPRVMPKDPILFDGGHAPWWLFNLNSMSLT